MLFIADCDRLLGLSDRQLIKWLNLATDVSWIRWPILFVLIGSYRIRDTMKGLGATHVVDLDVIPFDDLWRELVDKIFGPTSRADAEMLHQGCGGTVGRLLHVARMQGIEPPYHVKDGEIRKLPS